MTIHPEDVLKDAADAIHDAEDMVGRLEVHQAAKLLNCSARFVRKLIKGGKLRAVNIGDGKRARWRLRRADIAAFERARESTRAHQTVPVLP